MRREGLPWIVVLVILLAAGYLVGQRFVAPSVDQEAAAPAEAEDASARAFRPKFWEDRGLDMATQVGLIFVGALSMAALLPEGREGAG